MEMLLKQLHKRELIYARITGTDLTLHYLQPREDDRTVNRFARELERYNEIKIQKLEAMIALLDQKQCVERGILSYFGEHLKEDCGRCSYCRKKHPIDIKRSIELLVSQGEINLDDIIHQIAAPKTEILTELRQLTDDGIIINIAGKAFRINER